MLNDPNSPDNTFKKPGHFAPLTFLEDLSSLDKKTKKVIWQNI